MSAESKTTRKRKEKAAGKRAKAGTSLAATEDRRVSFINAYLENGRNATQAAITAGFSEKTASQAASRLLRYVKVQQEIATRTAELAAISGLNTERTLREVARLAYFDPRKFFNADGSLKPIHELDEDSAACLAGLDIEELFEGQGRDRKQVGTIKKLTLVTKPAALDMAMKFHGLYKDSENKLRPVIFNLNMGGPPRD